MTIADLGPHDWQNYVDYWRDTDAEWLQARSILRVDSISNLSAYIPAPQVGQVVHVRDVAGGQKDVLHLYASQTTLPNGTAGPAGWTAYSPLPKNLFASEDSTTRVTLGHHPGNVASVVPALALSPTGVAVVSDLTVRAGILKVTAADVQIKTGAAVATLTTDSTSLVSSIPIKAPGLVSSGAITAAGQALTAGAVTATTLTTTGALTSQSTLNVAGAATAAVVNAGTGAGGGFKADKAAYLGDANGAVIRRTDWSAGKCQITVYDANITFDGGTTIMDNQLAIWRGRSINWYNSAGTHVGYSGPVIYSGSDPGGPNGTIWVIP